MIRIKQNTSKLGQAASALFLFLLISPHVAGQGENLYSPAVFIGELTLPGTGNQFLRPARILVDHSSDEILVADRGNNRIVIFDQGGVYNFDFSVGEYCGVPTDIAVDSTGRIYLLGSTSKGKRIFVFDYDGIYLNDLGLRIGAENEFPGIEAIAIDDNDFLFALDARSYRIAVFDLSGSFLREFPVLADIRDDERAEIPLMSFTINGDDIYIPAPIAGTVYRYDRRGNLLNFIGHRGATSGELNFPISVSLTQDNIVLVLDKHRFVVVCYTRDGRFLGEFGGKGINPGWFYHPSWMDVDSDNRIYIGQVFQNKIQICGLPEFIKSGKNMTVGDDRLN